MDIYDFLNDFNSSYDGAQDSAGSAKPPAAASNTDAGNTSDPSGSALQSAPPVKPSGYPKTRAEAEAMGYKPLTDTAPEVQPCEFGYPCNDCGFCH